MPDEGDKTEQPTARRRQEARSRGQIAKSQDLSAAVLLLAGLLILEGFGGGLLTRLGRLTQFLLGCGDSPAWTPTEMVALGRQSAEELFSLMVPMLLTFFAIAVVVSVLQTGLLFTTEPLRWSLDRLNPISGLKKLFSMQSLISLLINLAKLTVVGGVVYYAALDQLDRILFAAGMHFSEMVQMAIGLLFSLGLRVGVVLLLLGIIDWFYQRFKHERSLRMSKHEVKEEMRRMEGDPLMKRRRREVQMQLALQRLRRDVPKADVVVTNPTHVAVALKYDAATMSAPRVVAKGEGYVAQRIREVALAAGIPVVERQPLARALFKLVEVGGEIPPHLYQAVAEVLAYIYQLSGQRSAAVPTP